MNRIIVLFFLILLAGCANKVHKSYPAPVEKSTTKYCASGETENCRQWTPGERAGAGSRGHSNQPDEPK